MGHLAASLEHSESVFFRIISTNRPCPLACLPAIEANASPPKVEYLGTSGWPAKCWLRDSVYFF
jgi:hypothetical protein